MADFFESERMAAARARLWIAPSAHSIHERGLTDSEGRLAGTPATPTRNMASEQGSGDAAYKAAQMARKARAERPIPVRVGDWVSFVLPRGDPDSRKNDAQFIEGRYYAQISDVSEWYALAVLEVAVWRTFALTGESISFEVIGHWSGSDFRVETL